jgi:hypothetical protein
MLLAQKSHRYPVLAGFVSLGYFSRSSRCFIDYRWKVVIFTSKGIYVYRWLLTKRALCVEGEIISSFPPPKKNLENMDSSRSRCHHQKSTKTADRVLGLAKAI